MSAPEWPVCRGGHARWAHHICLDCGKDVRTGKRPEPQLGEPVVIDGQKYRIRAMGPETIELGAGPSWRTTTKPVTIPAQPMILDPVPGVWRLLAGWTPRPWGDDSPEPAQAPRFDPVAPGQLDLW